ncbi:hypothetical protein M9458_051929 [Cirrhinus mrigala]|uniref:ATP-dependent helicase Rep n=1 Tax=Cirrhinus mrigala TaxID=683832 RepID=A0ABD0MUH0_CIRMR
MPKATAKTRHLNAPRQSAPGREQPVKRWCFTINNPTADERRHIEQVVTADTADFCVIGDEVGDSGTPHLQGFINMKVKRRLQTMKNWLNARAHFEPAKGSDLQNDEYCSKGGNVYLRIGQPTKVFVFVGRPGCGKSKMAADLCTGSATYYKPRGPWWDGYDGHVNVVIDDFYGWMSCDELLRVCDRYPCKVPVKGAFAEFVARNVYITSNRHVWE